MENVASWESVWLSGYIQGLEAFAHLKDGVQYVGTCGMTLKDAIAEAKKKYPTQPDSPCMDGEGHVSHDFIVDGPINRCRKCGTRRDVYGNPV